MAQEFASDNSKNGLFSRLNLSNHRGFFSFIFVTLSVIFILITFAAVQQQQTTQSKATGDTNICSSFDCNSVVPGPFSADAEKLDKCSNVPCCKWVGVGSGNYNCISKEASLTCSSINSYSNYGKNNQTLCNRFSASCEWDRENLKCVNIGASEPPPAPGTEVGSTSLITCLSGISEGSRCKSNSGATVGTCCDGTTCTSLNDGTKVAVCRESTTQLPASSGATSTIAEKCRSYGLGPNGEVTCPAKARQNNVECKWVPTPGSTTAGQCIPKTTTNPPAVNPPIVNPPGDGGGGLTKVTCTDFTSQTACLPADQCTWITKRGTTDTKICQRVCSRIPDQSTCDKRNDCQWSNNACVSKTTTPTGPTGNAELNLKLSFQGIVSLPKTKTELKVKVKLVDAASKEKEKDASIFTADSSGIWSGKVTFSDVDLSQKYYLLIKGPMHVQKKICKSDAADPNPGYYSCQFGNITLVSGSNDFDFSQVKILVGDLANPDQNGIVNREDTGVVLNALLLPVDQRQSAETLEKADLNLDGIVSTQDWSLMLEALKIKYDEK